MFSKLVLLSTMVVVPQVLALVGRAPFSHMLVARQGTACDAACSVFQSALNTCTTASCLCTRSVNSGLQSCVTCAVTASPDAATVSAARTLIDTFASTCSGFGLPPVTIPSTTTPPPTTPPPTTPSPPISTPRPVTPPPVTPTPSTTLSTPITSPTPPTTVSRFTVTAPTTISRTIVRPGDSTSTDGTDSPSPTPSPNTTSAGSPRSIFSSGAVGLAILLGAFVAL